MKQNVGFTDKIIRVAIAGILIGLYVSGIVSDILGFLLLVLAIVLILTSLFSYCGLYNIFRFSTISGKKKDI